MPQLRIKGSICYNDGTPASNVKIQIIEKDTLPGGTDDLIFNSTSNAQGNYEGTTSEWKDFEGKGPFNVLIPDVFVPTFKVISPMGTHTGPLILVGEQCAPIILPFNPYKPVGNSNRELVQITYIPASYDNPGERELYKFIEDMSNSLVSNNLDSKYKTVHRISGNNATLSGFIQKLNLATNDNSTLAVDVIFCTHGNTNTMQFFDDTYSSDTVKQRILDTIASNKRAKLRMIFSTACYGSTHNANWLGAGFKVASGSKKIYADSQFSLTPFLRSWKDEKTFKECIDAANNADPLLAGDNLAKAFYHAKNKPNLAADVNSNRVINGNADLRIYSSIN